MGTITRSFANLITASGPSSVPALETLTLNNIQFPATAVSSANANNLDDYEEGTWTGELKGQTTSATVPVTATGKYVKIGRLVFVTIYFAGVDTTGATGNAQISGLPFSSDGLQILSVMTYNQDYDDATAIMSINMYVENNAVATLIATKDNEPWQVTGISAGVSKFFALTGTYTTTS